MAWSKQFEEKKARIGTQWTDQRRDLHFGSREHSPTLWTDRAVLHRGRIFQTLHRSEVKIAGFVADGYFIDIGIPGGIRPCTIRL